MLWVRSASLHKRINQLPGTGGLSQGLVRIKADRYPASAELLELVCVINFSASGRMNEMVSMRLRCTGRVLIETRQLPYRGPYSLASHDFKLRSRLPGISFPSPGVYNLDIMINGTPAYTLEIHMV